MGLNIRGRSFLTLLDYTPEEINYLIDLAMEFKRMKTPASSTSGSPTSRSFCSSRRPPPAPAARSRWAPAISAWA